MSSPLVFAQPGYEALTADIISRLGAEEGRVERAHFPDGERYQRIATPVEERAVMSVV